MAYQVQRFTNIIWIDWFIHALDNVKNASNGFRIWCMIVCDYHLQSRTYQTCLSINRLGFISTHALINARTRAQLYIWIYDFSYLSNAYVWFLCVWFCWLCIWFFHQYWITVYEPRQLRWIWTLWQIPLITRTSTLWQTWLRGTSFPFELVYL